jgi:hypothetical protein
MDPAKPVRTYLDPDAVGPLPRSALADDSDALAAARTILRAPDSATQEIRPDDLIEVVDPDLRVGSIAPVGYDTSAFKLPRRRLALYVLSVLVVAFAVLVVALVRLAVSPTTEPSLPVAARAPQAPIVVPVTPSPLPPRAQSNVGTLRVDGMVEGQRVYVDGVALTAPAALLLCGPHELAVGSPAHARPIDVPCGGEVTVFR